MIRRRRRTREIAFSFDSFLDVVANVVGIIIRLILVVWVGARSYTGIRSAAPAVAPAPAESMEPADPLVSELEQRRRELAQAQNRLLDQLRQLDQNRTQHAVPEKEWTALAARRQILERERASLDNEASSQNRVIQTAALSGEEIQKRSRRLMDEIKDLEKLPTLKKTFRYKTPVSQPVQAEELLFECQGGRVTFIDIGAMLHEVRANIQDKGDQLRSKWQVEGVVGPTGAFRLHYQIERERGMLGMAGTPDDHASFRYGLTGWVVEPVTPVRGEPAEAALAPNSEFRRIVDAIDPQQTVVTFFVYPDSFAAFRRLRDYLYERDVVVAGRPLPNGAPITASSRNGTRSRGQ
jgi:hypothetical protein